MAQNWLKEKSCLNATKQTLLTVKFFIKETYFLKRNHTVFWSEAWFFCSCVLAKQSYFLSLSAFEFGAVLAANEILRYKVMAKSWIRTGFGRSYGKYRMGPDRIYGKLRKITISKYRDLAPLPVKISML